MKALILALFISFSAHAVPNPNSVEPEPLTNASFSISSPSDSEVLNICGKPTDLIAAAKALLRRYFKTDMYNATLFDKFLWLHPEHEDFIACIVCKSGKALDPYWERDFIRMCNERGEAILFVNEEHDPDSKLL